MKLYIVRHAQTNYNVLQLCNDDPLVDVHLTPKGIAQATDQAKKLLQVPFEHIFVSELKRTQQTADIINTYHSAPITVDPRLNDNRSGFEGRPVAEYYAARNAAPEKWTTRFNGGESVEDVKIRVEHFINDLKAKSYTVVLVVGSQVITRAFHSIVNNIPTQEAWDLEVDNGSCLELELK